MVLRKASSPAFTPPCPSQTRPRSGPFIAHLARFRREDSGSVAIIFALMFVALGLFVGAAVDLGRWLQARHQTIAAMDAAVLAGGRVLQLDDKDVTGARATAYRYYSENIKGRTPLVEDTITFDAIEDNTAFAAMGNAYMPTTFLNLARISRLPLLNLSESHFSKVDLVSTGGSQGDSSIEISLMLDVTGSMSGSKITDLKLAAEDLVNIVISDSSRAKPVRVALVPFAEGVRLPQSALSVARGSPASSVTVGSGWNKATYYRAECVVERKGNEKYTDAAPGTNTYVMTMYNSSGRCGLPAADEIVPLTKDKTLLKSRINGLVLSNTTAGHIGTAWAWYVLSPNWNALWNTANKAAAHGEETEKIAILMTDGEYNLQYDTNGISTGSTGAGSAVNGSSTDQARALCTAIKAKGITVYTIGFALGRNSTAVNTLNHCATDPSKAYTPENGEELRETFRNIALKINQLYLTH
ncbi:pilus assembly protein [Hyphomicrobium sp. CS1GBMeth3]|uniref:pilus assembly protein n=1 Tax=Hyphomicrobium sp. CS1GBMeth3 TaxID=1892845 RepID=UPI0009FA6F1A|nr:pilus assembly protein [Hyphomicrobium sp. CS1GBMeth3]